MGGALEEDTDDFQEFRHVVAHVLIQPVQHQAHACALVEVAQYRQRLQVRAQGAFHPFGVHTYRVADHAPQVPQEYIPLYGAVNMEDCPLPGNAPLHQGRQALLGIPKLEVQFYDIVHPGRHGGLRQGGDVLEVVVKGVPVQLAAVRNLLHGDFAIGHFLQKLPESLADLLLGTVHRRPPSGCFAQ